MKKLGYIDAMRGFAILGVLINHYKPIGSEHYPQSIANIISNGGRGVQLFYIVSAFTLFLSYSQRKDSENNTLGNFFIRRFFRIAPMYYLTMVYYVVLYYFPFTYLSNSNLFAVEWKIMSNLFFFHGLSPYWINGIIPVGWSVAIEVQFYCLLPLLFKKITNLNRAVILLVVSVSLNTCLKFFINKYSLDSAGLIWETFFYFWFPNQLPTFACGIIVFYLVTMSKTEWKINPTIILVASSVLLLDLASGKKLLSSDVLSFSLVFVVIVYILSKTNFSVFVNPISRYVGKISYSMYLLHFVVLSWMINVGIMKSLTAYFSASPILLYFFPFLIWAGFTVALSTVTYYFIEMPFQKIGAKLIKKREKSNQISYVHESSTY